MTKLFYSVVVPALVACGGAVGASGALAGVYLGGNARGDQVLLHSVLGQPSRSLYLGERSAGSAFGPFSALTPPAAFGSLAATVDDGGGAVAAWATSGPSGRGALMATTRTAGGKFSPPVKLADAQAAVALSGNDRGDALAAWSGSPQKPIRYSIRPSGGDFGPALSVGGSGGWLVGGSIDNSGGALLVWMELVAPQQTTRLVTSVRPPGGEFSAPKEVAGVSGNADAFSFAASRPGGALVAWNDFRGSILAVERQPGGDFGAPFKVAPSGSYYATVRDLDLASSGAAAVAFGYTDLTVAARDPGAAFGAPQQVGTFGQGDSARSNSASIGVDEQGDAAVAWGRDDHLLQGAYRPSDGSFMQPVVLAPRRPFAPGGPAVPSIAIDSGGRATAAWEESDGATVRTYTRDFDGTAFGPPMLVDSVRSYRQERPARTCLAGRDPILRRGPRSVIRDYGGSIYGCLFARGTPVPLNTTDETPYPPRTMALAGALVAYAWDYAAHSTSYTDLVVTDLRDPSFGVNRFTQLDSSVASELAASRLKPDGAVAWISCPTRDTNFGTVDRRCRRPGGRLKHVFVWGAREVKPRLVGRGRGIDPSSLTLHGSTLTWRDGTKLHRASLR